MEPGCLFGYLLTNTAQIFADLRNLLEPGGGETRDGLHARGIRRPTVSCTSSTPAPPPLDGAGRPKRRPGRTTSMKPFWEISDDEAKPALSDQPGTPADGIFPAVVGVTRFKTRGRNGLHDDPPEPLRHQLGPCLHRSLKALLWNCRTRCTTPSTSATNPPDVADDLVCTASYRRGCFSAARMK